MVILNNNYSLKNINPLHFLFLARQHNFFIRKIHSNALVRTNLQTLLIKPRINPLVRQNITKRLLSGAHDHSKIWLLEKAVSVGLLAVIPLALAYPNPVLDYVLALSFIVHIHWGFEALVVDYIRPSLFGPVIPKVALATLYLVSIMALAGLFYLNYSDVGLSTAIKMFMKNSN